MSGRQPEPQQLSEMLKGGSVSQPWYSGGWYSRILSLLHEAQGMQRSLWITDSLWRVVATLL